MPLVWAEPVNRAFICQNQTMAVTTTDLNDLIIYFLHMWGPINERTASLLMVTKAKLPVAVIAKSEQLTGFSEQGRS